MVTRITRTITDAVILIVSTFLRLASVHYCSTTGMARNPVHMLIPFSAKCSGNVPQRTKTESSSMETPMTVVRWRLRSRPILYRPVFDAAPPRLLKMPAFRASAFPLLAPALLITRDRSLLADAWQWSITELAKVSRGALCVRAAKHRPPSTRRRTSCRQQIGILKARPVPARHLTFRQVQPADPLAW